jgi:integrase
MKRRLNNEGSVSFVASRNHWRAAVRVTDHKGESKRHFFYGKTSDEALEKMRVAQKRMALGKPAKDAKLTVRSWIEMWVQDVLPFSDRKVTTQETYQYVLRHVLADDVASKELNRVLPSDLNRLFSKLLRQGMASSSVNKVYTVLKLVFHDAIIERKIVESPFASVKAPKQQTKEAEFFTKAQLSAFLTAAKDDRLYVAMQLCAQTGLRRGEALALRWSDIDFESKKLRVANTLASTKGGLYLTPPKTDASKRKIAMNDAVVALLQSHRIAQSEEARLAGNQFLDKDFVFCTQTGEPVHPDNFYRSVTRVCEKAGLEKRGPHALRHTFATLLLEANVPHHVVSRILGHSSIRITVDIYGHLSDEGQEAAMGKFASILTPSIDGPAE